MIAKNTLQKRREYHQSKKSQHHGGHAGKQLNRRLQPLLQRRRRELRNIDRRRQRERHAEQQRDRRGLERADDERDEIVFVNAPDGLPHVAILRAAVGPLVWPNQVAPFGRVHRGVLVLRRFLRLLFADFHQRHERFLVEPLELRGGQAQILAHFGGRQFVDRLRGNGRARGGTVHLAEGHGQGLPRDEHKNKEHHENGRERHEEDQLLRQPFRRARAVSALDAHPADGAFGGVRSSCHERGAGFQTCCVADFQIGGASALSNASGNRRPAGWETRDPADLEVCATVVRLALVGGFVTRGEFERAGRNWPVTFW